MGLLGPPAILGSFNKVNAWWNGLDSVSHLGWWCLRGVFFWVFNGRYLSAGLQFHREDLCKRRREKGMEITRSYEYVEVDFEARSLKAPLWDIMKII